jgi:hypothetical protein
MEALKLSSALLSDLQLTGLALRPADGLFKPFEGARARARHARGGGAPDRSRMRSDPDFRPDGIPFASTRGGAGLPCIGSFLHAGASWEAVSQRWPGCSAQFCLSL